MRQKIHTAVAVAVALARPALALLALAGLPVNAGAAGLHVPGDFPTIQAAIDAAAPGDSVLLACGRYTWSGEGSGDPTTGLIRMKSGIVLRGEAGDPACVVVDAEGQGRVAWCDHVDATSAIEAITLTGGIGLEEAGGLRLSASSPRITDCIFTGNWAEYDGGAVRCRLHSEPVFTRCVFHHNTAEVVAGAVTCDFSPATFDRCIFHDNTAGGVGGALQLGYQDGAVVRECIFVRNSAGEFGGAVGVYDNAVTLTGCTFWGNSAPGGSAVGIQRASATLSECILSFSTLGDALTCRDMGDAVITCSDVVGNAGGDWVGCLAGHEGVDGNFSADPLFCDPEILDLTLTGHSPCLPGEHPGGGDCGLIGALGYGCGDPTATAPATWGALKVRFN